MLGLSFALLILGLKVELVIDLEEGGNQIQGCGPKCLCTTLKKKSGDGSSGGGGGHSKLWRYIGVVVQPVSCSHF
ncbi:hypothetical protein CEXT_51361 [Caerostris extrusa]|uniref:Uncharacterized protein n=1 Tax=Caerostris extrusa TaxID=172846 RepID=A0AAV4ML84_CAEEX|nr:hypothetical protein CEXT_51361 [Caerostris extrusa]